MLGRPQRRELIAWFFALSQFIILATKITSTTFSQSDTQKVMRNGGVQPDQILNSDAALTTTIDNIIHEKIRRRRILSSKTPPPISDTELTITHAENYGLVSRTWHSNGSPSTHPGFQRGSCWCGARYGWCTCTPSLAIDLILKSGPEHLWVVKRKDTGQFALMGGFTEVGETTEETVKRELEEEMSIVLEQYYHLVLFGIYSDPHRDARRHTVSAVYVVDIPENIVPTAGDDAKSVQRIRMSEANHLDFFADHKTIINDFVERYSASPSDENTGEVSGRKNQPELIKRSICQSKQYA